MNRLSILTVALSAGLAISISAIQLTTANAQASGEVITFLIPEPAHIELTSADTKVIFAGGPASTIDITGCGTGERAIQQVLIKNPGQPLIRTTAVILSPAIVVDSGTQVGTFSFDSQCMIGNTPYTRYDATVK